jgi:ABC-type multidrug transport system fused ATPase/permease subunit
MKKIELILSLLNKREKRQLVFVVFALLVMGFIELVGVGSISPFISVVSNPEIIHTNEYLDFVYNYLNFSSDTGFIIAFGIVIIVIIAVSNVCLAGITFIIYIYSGKRFHSISMRLFEKYLRQPYIFFLNVNTAELIKKITGDLHTYINRILVVSLQIIANSIIAVFIIALLVIADPLLSLIISLVISLSYLVIFFFTRGFLSRKGVERNKHNYLKYKYINETFGGIKDIKLLGKEKVFLNLFFLPSKKYAMNDAISDAINGLPKYLLELIAFGCIIGIILFMIETGSKVEEFLPVLALYAFGAYRLLPAFQKIFSAVASIKYYFPIVESFNEIFAKLPEGERLIDLNVPRIEFHNISLRNIVFRYPASNKNIINNQSINIEANTSIAFIGATGCGKTTFVDIVLGLLEPQNGSIFVDGTEITADNKRAWQRNFGYVPQSIYLIDDTVRNNIAFGIEPEKIDDGAVIKAARIANIQDFIMNEMENGYDTIVGERGIRLSGGQRQRIGIARAMYHDPSVLVLDEATSALDGLTENAIMDAILNLSHKKTIIMIAHRITTVKHCDIIYLMDKGQVIDRGGYEELYQRNAMFKKMADGG